MELRIPWVMPGRRASCQVRGFSLQPGTQIRAGETLAELRVELQDDAFSDCPVLQYGDLVARGGGQVKAVYLAQEQGALLAEVGDEPGEFPVDFVTF